VPAPLCTAHGRDRLNLAQPAGKTSPETSPESTGGPNWWSQLPCIDRPGTRRCACVLHHSIWQRPLARLKLGGGSIPPAAYTASFNSFYLQITARAMNHASEVRGFLAVLQPQARGTVAYRQHHGTWTVPVPGKVPNKMPKAGTYALHTQPTIMHSCRAPCWED
jgi:hypothetical protein